MEQPQASPPVYKPSLHNHHHQTPTLASSELASTDQCHSVGDMKDSQLVGVKVALARDVDMAEEKEVKMEVAVVGKRKRGRPARGLPRTPPPLKKKRDEEDVCFICFDGGSLVLCDRRGCPKAYHPACIKRDESFFRSKAKWNCGWHICSICQKASHYMCYTCTYSVCKGCTNGADFVCVRGNKGLCGACMRTIMLIENIGQGSKAMCEVDFDDKSSWEYLFKVYWMYLKGKLSLTLDELVQARNPWKGAAPMSYKVKAPRELHHLKDDKGSGSENSCIDIESNNLENKKSKRQSKLLHKEDCFDRISSCGDNSVCVSLPECTQWASKELLEFVAHMKNGDTSLLSQFDVHTLLLEYVKKNNLCDPQQKCQIVCDSRLLNLFGKTRLGHSEMLKLLESHFLIKENGPEETTVRAGIIDAVASQGEAGDNYNNQLMLVNDKRHKTQTWKNADVQVTQNNPDEYAAINAHNINLIYLRRSLMENLTEEAEKIHEKVVGSFVRIRMSSSDQKQEMYRLVQVVGTSKVAEPYKIGARTTDIVLEISNLNRKEVIKIDEISNLEFSEDECKRLRQSIKYGFSKRLTVGEIHDKALTLQPMRVNDLLESEILQLNHLRDRASEKGYRKELIECVEKLQLLSSPEERQRRLREMPEIHSDPNIDSMFDSDEDADESDERKQDDNIRSKCSGFDRKESGSISPSQDGVLNDVGCRTQELPTAQESIGNICVIKNQINPNDVGIDDSTKAGVVRSEASGVSLDISSLFLSTGMEQQFNDFVNDKSWHYQDPTGKVQGPFTLLQLYKWNASGHFPPDLRIWRMDGKQDDAMLLTDALPCSKDVSLPYNSQLPSSGVSVRLDNGDNSQDDGENTTNKIQSDKRIVEQSWEQKMDDPCTQSNGKDESVRSNGWQSHSSSSSIPADGNNKEQSGKSERREESFTCEISCHEQPQVYLSLHSTAFFENLNENPSDKLREGHGIEGNSEEDNGNHGSNRTSEGQSNSAQSSLKQADSEENSGQSSGQNWRRPHVNSSSNCLVTTSALVSVRETSPQKLGFNLPSPAPVTSSSNCRDSPSAFVSVAKQSPNHLEIDFFELPSHTSKPGNSESLGQSAENKQLASSNVPVQEAGPSWSTTSSLVNGGTALPEVAVEWRRYSPAPPNPSVEEWDSNVVSASPLKPAETVGDCAATPSSICGQLTHSSPSHPACNTSTWQAIIGESNDVDESVSDLLAEVEALESLGGLDSPTSIMNCGEELTEGSKTECLSSAEGLSPMLDGGKGDALSSTGDIKLSSQPTTAEEPLCRADVHHHHQRISGEHSSRSSEGTKKNGVSGNQWESGAENPSIVPSSVAWDLTTDTWRLGSESTRGGWEVSQGNANLDWGGMHQGNANMGWGAGQPTVQENRSANSYTSIGGTAAGFGGSETRYGSDRFSAPRDRGFQGHGRESSFFGRGRTAGNRQPLYGFGNGGSHKPQPKGQRICKFYGSGYCKKGASCDYLHL